jgi:nitroreductase
VEDCSAATQNILLAATLLELGTVWCGVHPISTIEKAVRKTLDIPEAVIPLNVIFVGYPAEQKPARTQYSAQNVFDEKFGN